MTANKREESINKVGLTIKALGSEQLKQERITSFQDLAAAVPGLSYSQTEAGTPVYTLRGIGFYDSSLSAFPAVTVYMDQAPLPLPVETALALFDLGRVEVLKGPQGTVFGNNATGGAINYIAAKPTEDERAGMSVSYGRFQTVEADGYASGPLTEHLLARLVAFIPSFTNYVPNPLPKPFIPNATDDPQLADWTHQNAPFADNRLWQATARVDYDVTATLSLTSITSYTDYEQHQRPEGDGLAEQRNDIIVDDGAIKNVFQELRLANNVSSALRWMVGGNFEHNIIDENNIFDFADGTAHYPPSLPAHLDLVGVTPGHWRSLYGEPPGFA